MARTEKTGGIRTQSGREDARATHVFLTAAGRKLLGQMGELNRQLNEQLRGDFSDADMDVVVRFLSHVLERFSRLER